MRTLKLIVMFSVTRFLQLLICTITVTFNCHMIYAHAQTQCTHALRMLHTRIHASLRHYMQDTCSIHALALYMLRARIRASHAVHAACTHSRLTHTLCMLRARIHASLTRASTTKNRLDFLLLAPFGQTTTTHALAHARTHTRTLTTTTSRISRLSTRARAREGVSRRVVTRTRHHSFLGSLAFSPARVFYPARAGSLSRFHALLERNESGQDPPRLFARLQFSHRFLLLFLIHLFHSLLFQ